MQDGRRRQFKGITYSVTLCPSLCDRHSDLLCLHIWTKDSQVQSATHLILCIAPPTWAAEVEAMFPSRGACLRLRGAMGTYERVLCGVGCAAAESFSPPPPPSPSCWQLQKGSKASFSETAAAIATCSILSGASSSSGTGAGVDLLKREVSGTTLCERSQLIGPGCSHIEYLHNCAILLCFGHKG